MSFNKKMMSSSNKMMSSSNKTKSLVKPFVQGFETIDDPFSTSPEPTKAEEEEEAAKAINNLRSHGVMIVKKKDDLTTLQNDLKRIVKILDDTAETAPEYQHVLNQACDCQDLLTETENDLEFLWRKYTSIALGYVYYSSFLPCSIFADLEPQQAHNSKTEGAALSMLPDGPGWWYPWFTSNEPRILPCREAQVADHNNQKQRWSVFITLTSIEIKLFSLASCLFLHVWCDVAVCLCMCLGVVKIVVTPTPEILRASLPRFFFSALRKQELFPSPAPPA